MQVQRYELFYVAKYNLGKVRLDPIQRGVSPLTQYSACFARLLCCTACAALLADICRWFVLCIRKQSLESTQADWLKIVFV